MPQHACIQPPRSGPGQGWSFGSAAALNKRIGEVRAGFKAEIKVEVRGMGEKLDQVLETLLTAQS